MSEIRTILQDKKRKTRTPFSKDVLVFLFCVALSTIFWLLFTLSKSKETELHIPIEYKNLPAKYIITDSLHQEVKVKVKDSGFSILMYQISHKKNNILIDLKNCFPNNGRNISICKKDLKKSVLKSISPTMSIIQIEPAYLKINYEKLYEKELPIKLKGEIDLSQQHILKDQIKLIPSRIKVYGSKKMLDTLSVIYTKNLSVKNLSSSTKIITNPNPIRNLRFATTEIQVIIPVELYTEKTIAIPIVGKNFPKNIQLKTFPATVNVRFIVGLSRFNLIKPDDIQAFIDYNSLLNSKEGKQLVQVRTSISNITNLNHSPKMVEYILEEK